MVTNAFSVTNDLDALTFRGGTVKRALGDAVTECTIEMTMDQSSQLTIDLEDPNFAILNRGLLNNGVYVDYKELRLQIATTTTGPGVAGVGGVTVNARPVAIQKLKARKGKLVMRNLSPTQFLASECKKAGVRYSAQPSARRKMISRDIPDKANAGDKSDPPSTWTTLRRLADELGFLIFEDAGTIYFGNPTWIASKGRRVYASWNYGDIKYRAVNPPVCSKSIDDSGVSTVTIEMPAWRAIDFRPGRVLVLRGVPGFNGGFLINSVSYSLMQMEGTISVTASTPTNLLTHQAVPITTNVTFPTAGRQIVTTNSAFVGDASAQITEPRRNTKSRIDLVYWARESISDTYYVVDDKDALPSQEEGALEGLDLLNYALFQVGMRTYSSLQALEDACISGGTKLTTLEAINRPGALLFADNYVALSTQIRLHTIEPRGRIYVEVQNALQLNRFHAAYLLGGMTG